MSLIPFPNIPKVLGAPVVPRGPINNAVNSLSGAIRARVDIGTGALTGALTGAVSGAVTRANGVLSQVVGQVSGTFDPSGGVITGALRGQIAGGGGFSATLAGRVLGTATDGGNLLGPLAGRLSSVVGSLAGNALDVGSFGAGFALAPQWGLFTDGGDPVITAESVVGVEFDKENRISTYPVEDGGFQSYNKVELPFDARVIFAQGGTEADRSLFLSTVETAVASLELVTVVTPEFDYPSANVVGYGYRRTQERGATLLTVEVRVQQVRTSATLTFSAPTKRPAGATPTNTGPVLPRTPTPIQAAAVGEGL